MKKLILCGSALLLSLSFAKAQTQTTEGWNANGFFDDFSSATELTDVTYNVDAHFTKTRAGDGSLKISTVGTIGGNGSGTYPNFQAAFSQLNLLTLDNADVEFNVTNNTNGDIFVKIQLGDASNVQGDIEPNVSDVTSSVNWTDPVNGKYPRKANNGFYLAQGGTQTFRIDLSSTANLGGLTRVGWYGDGGAASTACGQNAPICAPTTAYQINPAQIKTLTFTVNWDDGSYCLSQGLGDGDYTDDYIPSSNSDVAAINGDIIFTYLKIGNALSTPTSITDATVNNSLKVYPNPAKEVLNVSFDAANGATVNLTDLAGHSVYTSSTSAGSNNMTINTSGIQTGMYILNVATENGNSTRKVSIR